MTQTYAQLMDLIESGLQDTTNAIWSTTELGLEFANCLREISEYSPYRVKEPFVLESRTGTATATTASALVDTTNVQFLAADVGKVIYNTTDRTWAEVDSYVSTSQLTLSKDIMVSGEGYAMFHKGCSSAKEINIEDIDDYMWIEGVEYPTFGSPPNYRNWELNGDILLLVYDLGIPDSADSAPDIEVNVYFAKRHRVSQLTDLAGAIDLEGGYAAGTTTIHVDGLQAAAGTFEKDTEVTFYKTRGTYRVTADVSFEAAASECDIVIYPGLESAVADDDVVTIIGSSLNYRLERLLADLVIAKGKIKKSRIDTGGARKPGELEVMGRNDLALVYRDLERLAKPMVRRTWPRE